MLFNQDVYNDLIGYLAIQPGNGLPTTDRQILQAMNSALQEVYTKGPFYLRRDPGSCVLPAPVVVTFNVTQGSTTISALVGWTIQMTGCVVRIGGEPGDNEFINSTTLVTPITQASGPVVGTVYFNCFTLPAGAVAVAGDVYLDGWRQLDPLFYEEHQIFADTHSREMLDYSGAYILTNSAYQRLKVGVPTGYYVRPATVQTGPRFIQQLRVWPLPGSTVTLTWVTEMGAPPLSIANLDLGTPQPAPTQFVVLPGDTHETTWLPICRFKLSAYPHFLESKRAFITQQNTEALSNLKLLNPQRQPGAMLRPRVALPNSGRHY